MSTSTGGANNSIGGCFRTCLRRLLGALHQDGVGSSTVDAPGGATESKQHSTSTAMSNGTAEMKGSNGMPNGTSLNSGGNANGRVSAVELFKLLRREHHRLCDEQGRLLDPIANELRSQLDQLQAQDLGVSVADVRRLRGRSGIGYQEVYAGSEMTLCVFLMRAGACIPLHDHPNMYVFCRVLFGRLRVVSFDPEPIPEACMSDYDTDEIPPDRPRHRRLLEGYPPGSCRASLRNDEVLGPEATTCALTPYEGNVHELHALEDCAFFDVVTPPYDCLAGRDCTYFAREADDGNGSCVLVQSPPTNFTTEHCEYRGPPFPD